MISLQMMTFKWKRFVFTKCLYTFSTMCTVVSVEKNGNDEKSYRKLSKEEYDKPSKGNGKT